MSGLKIKQQHAIAWYAETHNYLLAAIQQQPVYTFYTKDKKQTIIQHITDIQNEYDSYLKAKERNRKNQAVWKQVKKPGYDV